ncbi:hypothetical protein [Caminicella sporogenes]|uniref:hypothetical protein n=1 Tax=Caminicella sporogenes TaxID=166485 RepID=UPI0025425ED0|nr:hypothetical protein [Caminicella sporogenes]WIF93989.1 hypothetical protein QNI18_06615 [Caminicella sporogenes]
MNMKFIGNLIEKFKNITNSSNLKNNINRNNNLINLRDTNVSNGEDSGSVYSDDNEKMD